MDHFHGGFKSAAPETFDKLLAAIDSSRRTAYFKHQEAVSPPAALSLSLRQITG